MDFIEIKVLNPQTQGVGSKKFTDYEVKTKTNFKTFKSEESSVRRRFSDFQWLKSELEKCSKMVPPTLPDAPLVSGVTRYLPFLKENEIFDEKFIENRRQGLEDFINKVAVHPLALNEKCLHMFLEDESIDKHYKPGKVVSH